MIDSHADRAVAAEADSGYAHDGHLGHLVAMFGDTVWLALLLTTHPSSGGCNWAGSPSLDSVRCYPVWLSGLTTSGSNGIFAR